MKTKGLSFIISCGSYGGFYFHNGTNSIRLCLGWVAFTFIPQDIDDVLDRLPEKQSA